MSILTDALAIGKYCVMQPLDNAAPGADPDVAALDGLTVVLVGIAWECAHAAPPEVSFPQNSGVALHSRADDSHSVPTLIDNGAAAVSGIDDAVDLKCAAEAVVIGSQRRDARLRHADLRHEILRGHATNLERPTKGVAERSHTLSVAKSV